MIVNTKTTDTMTKHKEKLTEEVQTLLSALANLGNTKNVITTAELERGSRDVEDADSWERFLDRLFNEVQVFADTKGIETE